MEKLLLNCLGVMSISLFIMIVIIFGKITWTIIHMPFPST